MTVSLTLNQLNVKGEHTNSSKVSKCVMLVLSGNTCTKLRARAKYDVPGTLHPDDGSVRNEYASPNANSAKYLHWLTVHPKSPV